MAQMKGQAMPAESGSPLPLYHKIYLIIREQIAEGAHDPEQPMQSEYELAARFSVSRITIRRALDRLEREGLIVRQRGRGTFPTARRTTPRLKAKASSNGLFEDLVAMGLATKVNLLEFGYVHCPTDVAHALKIKPGARVQKAVRVRSHQGQPMSHLTTYVPEEIGRTYEKEDLAAQPLLILLEACGIEVSTAEQTVSAKLADATVAPLLRIEIGAPLLAIVRVVCDQADRPVEYIRALYRPDIYEFQMSLSRVPGAKAAVWEPLSPSSARR